MMFLLSLVSALALLPESPLPAASSGEWHVVSSRNGDVSALLPGDAKESTETEKTIAGEILTHVKEFHTEGVQFTLSSTELPRLAMLFAKNSKILAAAKKGLLKKFNGKQTGLRAVKLDGFKAWELTYELDEVKNSEQSTHRGVAILTIKDGMLYTANAIITSHSGELQYEQFRKSISFTTVE